MQNLKSAFVIWMASLFTGCLMGGGGSDTEITNNTVSGIIHTSNSHNVVSAKVWLIPVQFRAPVDPANSIYQTDLDHNGNYQFLNVDTGTYNLEALDPKSGDRLLIRNLKITSNLNLPPDTTRATGSLSVLVSDSLAKMGGNIYVTGLLGQWKMNVGQNQILIDSLPSGVLPDIHIITQSVPSNNVLLSDSVQIKSTDKTVINSFSLWKYSAQIFITPFVSGVQLKNRVRNFPLLLRLDKTNLNFNQVAADGADLRFTKSTGEPLPFTIDFWDAVNSKATIWIKVDTIEPNNDKQFIRMYWGLESARALGLKPAVFDSTSGYVGVWHLDRNSSQTKIMADASEMKNDQSLFGNNSASVVDSGVIGSALNLDGSTDKLISSTDFDSPQTFTISLWFKTTNKNGGFLIDYSTPSQDTTKRDHDRQIWMDENGKLNFGVYVGWGDTTIPSNALGRKVVSSPKICNDGAWHWVAASLSPRGQMLYVDNEPVLIDSSVTRAAIYNKARWTLGYETIGDWVPWAGALYFEGMLDEVQVVHRDLGNDWLRLQFYNQSSNSNLLRFVH